MEDRPSVPPSWFLQSTEYSASPLPVPEPIEQSSTGTSTSTSQTSQATQPARVVCLFCRLVARLSCLLIFPDITKQYQLLHYSTSRTNYCYQFQDYRQYQASQTKTLGRSASISQLQSPIVPARRKQRSRQVRCSAASYLFLHSTLQFHHSCSCCKQEHWPTCCLGSQIVAVPLTYIYTGCSERITRFLPQHFSGREGTQTRPRTRSSKISQNPQQPVNRVLDTVALLIDIASIRLGV